MFEKLTDAFSNEDPAEQAERRPIEQLTGAETQHAIDYLNLLGKETTTQNIEWAAYQLQAEDVKLATPEETLKERGDQDKRLVAPRIVEDHPEFQIRDDKVSSIMTVTSLPRKVGLGWLVPLTLADANIRLSVHIQPRDAKSTRKKLQRRYTQAVTSLTLKQTRGRTDTYEDQLDRDDLQRILQNVIKGTTKLFDVSIYIELVADSKEELEEMRNRVDAILAEQDVDVAPIKHQQLDANGSVAPLCTDTIGNVHPIQLEALGTMFNLVEPSIYDPEGVLFGFDDSKRPVILNRYALSGHSMAISGKTGSGKSYFRKLEIYRRLLADPEVQCIFFDPAGDDYPKFAESLGGEVIRFGGEHTVNPLEISPPSDAELEGGVDTYALTIRSVIEMLNTHFEERDGLSAGEEGILIQAAHYACLSRRIILGEYETYDRDSPVFDDLFRGVDIVAAGGLEAARDQEIIDDTELEKFRSYGVLDETTSRHHLGEEPSDDARTIPVSNMLVTPTDHHRELARNLQPKFESFKPGGINYNLNGQTNLDLSSRVVVMDMSSFADTGEMPLILHAMLSWAYLEAKRSPFKIDVTFDEAHYLLGRPAARDLINLFIRHARHYEAGLTLMSQTAHEFVRTNERREVYENCDVKCLFYAESVSEETQEYYELSDDEIRFIQTAARGQDSEYSECLLSTSVHGRRRLEIRSGPFEHYVLVDSLDPWDWLEEVEGIERGDDLSLVGGPAVAEAVQPNDMPAVMGQDRDLELSMEMDQDERDIVVETETVDAGTDGPANESPDVTDSDSDRAGAGGA
ncbi:VirB4 family type IV secretion system protein (plasmid) [Halorientalis pallida]|uniref:VirB4 family type IV secretion system protein n=1 Tax=Halorientalis pallida TaxID=2479928 RepID=UPI003C6ECCB3